MPLSLASNINTNQQPATFISNLKKNSLHEMDTTLLFLQVLKN
jgi:hypothetical protein